MSRTPLSLVVPDLSTFTRALGRSLQARHDAAEGPPGHVELMNLIARALGQRNLQSLQSAQRLRPLPQSPVAQEDRPTPPALTEHARKALMQFDSRGRLLRWPTKLSVQRLAMWLLWTRVDGRKVYSEREVNTLLQSLHTFGDHATLRRELINRKLMQRTSDCAEYRKCPVRPDAEAQALLTAWRQLQRHQSDKSSALN